MCLDRRALRRLASLAALISGFCLSACSETNQVADTAAAVEKRAEDAVSTALANGADERFAYFGDLHVHTRYSFDAYIFGTRTNPDDAYRFGKGEPLAHASGKEMRLKSPLDFVAVTDHATYLGMFEEMDRADSIVGQHPLSIALRTASTAADRGKVYREILPRERGFVADDDLLDLTVVRGAWQEIVAAANRHNDPGKFTTFIGYEFTAGGRRGENLHRNVIFRGATAPAMPYSRLDAKNNEEKLWNWMDTERANGFESIAIPHNSNGSDGWMFQLTDRDGQPIDQAYAEQRMRNEPLVEVTQVKGTSDTHPSLSPNDEWADFEIMEQTIGSGQPSKAEGSYVREALRNGLAMAAAGGFNPYRFGLIGASDTHNAAGSFREEDYWSKSGLLDIRAAQRGSIPGEDGQYADTVRRWWGASGLAGVWAATNTREAIFDAFRRKETFATTGTRLRVRLFAGYALDIRMLTEPDGIQAAYDSGVPMGGELRARGVAAPRFLVWALQDASDAALDRVQIIKGWVADGKTYERVFDVACSSGATTDPTTFRCPDNGATVNMKTCAPSKGQGAPELKAFWRDPTFVPGQRAFYYVRALQNPTCRWSTYDALRAGVRVRPDLPATIQERAWSSPIWYVP